MKSPLPPLVDVGQELSQADLARFSRHVAIPNIGVSGQRRLRNAKVLVVGAGGLGSPALLYLAAAGVGTLGIVDDDVVEVSNLQRQVIHSTSSVGRSKVDSARESIGKLDPTTNVIVHNVRLQATNALKIFADYDVILDGTDNFSTRYLINDAAALLKKPYIWGSVYRDEGMASVFWDLHGPSYRDLYPAPPPAGTAPSCVEGGVFGTVCAAVGSVMVNEALKLITGTGRTLLGRLVIFDAMESSWQELAIPKADNSTPISELVDYELLCGAPSILESSSTVSVSQLQDLLSARESGQADFELVDVREPWESSIVRIPGSVLIPKDSLTSPENRAVLPTGKPIFLYCKTGTRSAEVLRQLLNEGRADVRQVRGGVLAWVNEIDPSQPRY